MASCCCLFAPSSYLVSDPPARHTFAAQRVWQSHVCTVTMRRVHVERAELVLWELEPFGRPFPATQLAHEHHELPHVVWSRLALIR